VSHSSHVEQRPGRQTDWLTDQQYNSDYKSKHNCIYYKNCILVSLKWLHVSADQATVTKNCM